MWWESLAELCHEIYSLIKIDKGKVFNIPIVFLSLSFPQLQESPHSNSYSKSYAQNTKASSLCDGKALLLSLNLSKEILNLICSPICLSPSLQWRDESLKTPTQFKKNPNSISKHKPCKMMWNVILKCTEMN